MPSSQTYIELNITPTLTQEGVFYVHMDKLPPKQEELPKHKGRLPQKDVDLLSRESYLPHFFTWQMPCLISGEQKRCTRERTKPHL